MIEISDYSKIMSVLKDDTFLIEGSADTIYDASEHNFLRQNFKKFLQNNLDFFISQFESEWEKVKYNIDEKTEFELMSDVVKPFCEALTFRILGIDNETDKRRLIEQSMAVFYMKYTEYHKDYAKKATIDIASFFYGHLMNQTSLLNYNLCPGFVEDKTEKSIAHLIQLLVAMVSSVPLLLANQIYVLLKDEKLSAEYYLNPASTTPGLIFRSGPMKHLYRQAGTGCPFAKGTIFKLNVKASKDKLENSYKMPDLGLGFGRYACLGTVFLKSISEFFPRAFFDSFPEAKPDLETIRFGGTHDIEGLTCLTFRINTFNN